MVSITVSAPPKPSAASYQESTGFETPLVVGADGGVLSNSTGTRIAVTGHTTPGHGAVQIEGTGAYTYTPANGFSGDDSFNYTITDAVGATAAGTVTIAVGTGLPPAPLAHNDSGTTAFETALIVASPGVLANDTGTGIAVTAHTTPAHGAVTTTATGGYTYTPSSGYAGPDAFDYTITDTATARRPPRLDHGVRTAEAGRRDLPGVDGLPDPSRRRRRHGLLSNSTGTRIALTGHTARRTAP